MKALIYIYIRLLRRRRRCPRPQKSFAVREPCVIVLYVFMRSLMPLYIRMQYTNL